MAYVVDTRPQRRFYSVTSIPLVLVAKMPDICSSATDLSLESFLFQRQKD